MVCLQWILIFFIWLCIRIYQSSSLGWNFRYDRILFIFIEDFLNKSKIIQMCIFYLYLFQQFFEWHNFQKDAWIRREIQVLELKIFYPSNVQILLQIITIIIMKHAGLGIFISKIYILYFINKIYYQMTVVDNISLRNLSMAFLWEIRILTLKSLPWLRKLWGIWLVQIHKIHLWQKILIWHIIRLVKLIKIIIFWAEWMWASNLR